MIKSINTNNSQWVTITDANSSGYVYIDSYKVQQGIAGQVRYTGSCLEVNDGNSWRPLSENYVYINLTGMANDALAWAMKKMTAEQEAAIAAEQYPAVQDALDKIKQAEDQLAVVMNLVKQHA